MNIPKHEYKHCITFFVVFKLLLENYIVFINVLKKSLEKKINAFVNGAHHLRREKYEVCERNRTLKKNLSSFKNAYIRTFSVKIGNKILY